MKKIVSASTNSMIIKTVRDACRNSATFSCTVTGDTEGAVSFINFELPEIKVIDYTSSSIDGDRILESIHNDSWLHYGGIIAVCGSRAEVRALEEKKDDNILSALTVEDFKRHSKCRFGKDNFIDSVDFDYMEFQVLEED